MWVWLSAPETRWLCASYALSLAIRDNRKCRLLIQSNWFRERYGHIFSLVADQNMKIRFENDKRGCRLAVSVGSAATGEGGDVLIIDDGHPIDDSTSDVQRQATLQWFDETWTSRLNSQEHGAMVVVGQRIHQDDISGHILELGGWEHLDLPAEFEPARKCFTAIWEDPRKQEGELLWPARFSQETLDRLKRQLGGMAYAAQYQQTPVPAGGGQFKKQWFRYFSETDDAYILETEQGTRTVLKADCWRFTVVDLAISSKQTADYTVIQTWAVTPSNDLLLIDQIRERLDNPVQQRAIRAVYLKYQPQFVKIEAVGYQLALIQQLRADPMVLDNGRRVSIPIREFRPVKDKVSRASTAAVYMENGKIYFLRGAAWTNTVEIELLQFPRAAHDDIVDSCSMAAEELTAAGIPLYDEPLPEDTPQPMTIAEIVQVNPFEWAMQHAGGEW